MASKLLTLSLLSAVAAAQSTTVSLFLPDTDPQSLVASVVSADSSATTYVVTCPSDTPSDECGYNPAETITAGPSIAAGGYELDGATATWSCALSGPATAATEASCLVTAAVSSMDASGYASALGLTSLSSSDLAAVSSALASVTPTTSVDSTVLSSSDITYFPVVVTAGAEKLSGNGSASATGSASGSVTTSAKGSGSGTSASGSKATGSSTGSGTSSGASSTSTGAAAGNKQLGLAAAGVAGIAFAAFAL